MPPRTSPNRDATPGPAEAPPAEVTALPWPGDSAARPFFEDDELRSLRSRACAYLRAGVAVRFQGPAGMGKTTMALRVAQDLGRPVAFLTGHSRLTPEDLIGREIGTSATRVEDKYIASVRRTETRTRSDWRDGVLTEAMTEGRTLVYDEFTRAPAEANAALLSVLEEGVLVVSHPSRGRMVLRAHPGFRLLLTSNPDDYRGVHQAPDALLDRFVTFDLEHVPPETEAGIVACATDLPRADADRIVRLTRDLRGRADPSMPVSMRTAILIGRLVAAQGIPVDPADPQFVQVCADVLNGRLSCDTAGALAPLLSACAGETPSRPLERRLQA